MLGGFILGHGFEPSFGAVGLDLNLMGPLLVCKMQVIRPASRVAMQGIGRGPGNHPDGSGSKEVLIFQSLHFLTYKGAGNTSLGTVVRLRCNQICM